MNWKNKLIKFKIGDRVYKYKPYSKDKYCKHGGSEISVPIGTKGVIRKIEGTPDSCEVQFDNTVYWTLDKSELRKLGF